MKRVLSVDGGGIRGLIPAVVLEAIEAKHGPLHAHYDLVVGTSTGGILACGIGHGLGAQRMRNIYLARAQDIFRRPLWWRARTGNGVWGPKWPNKYLAQVLEEHFGNVAFGVSETHVMVTAYDLDLGAPALFKSWRDPWRRLSRVDAAMATSVAPTYMAPWGSWIDGGVYANNPAQIALTEARKLWPGEPIELLSLGTGTRNPRWDAKTVRGWGLTSWAKAITAVIFDGASDSVDYHLARMPDLTYRRLQPRIEPIAMDTSDPDDLGALLGYGAAMAREWAA